jgi:hypothetical protein
MAVEVSGTAQEQNGGASVDYRCSVVTGWDLRVFAASRNRYHERNA